jgi:anthranilate synthase/aminodeoxychorismate synthase-like glutamine amidotransferase
LRAKGSAAKVPAMLLLIDNYDSFTFNLYHRLGEVFSARGEWREELIRVVRNDAITVDQALALGPRAIVLSPGPCDPDRAGICLDLIRAAAGRVPLLGVCLGHQAIGQAFGGRVVRAPVPMHGKVGQVQHRGSDLFAGLRNPLAATRYHSLVVARDTLPDALAVTAWNDEGLVMGLAHRTLPVWGVQFHPESIASEDGHALLGNFLDLARGANRVPA